VHKIQNAKSTDLYMTYIHICKCTFKKTHPDTYFIYLSNKEILLHF